MSAAKRKGTRNEHRSMALLEAAGYVCIRAAGSHGVWDFVAVGPHDIVFVQVKSNRWPGSVEMEAMQLFVVPSNGRKVVHRWDDRQRMPRVRDVA